jgi:hypothetical protein
MGWQRDEVAACKMFQLMMQQVLSIRSPLANGRWSIAMAQSQWHSRITAQPHNRAHACLRGHGVWGGGRCVASDGTGHRGTAWCRRLAVTRQKQARPCRFNVHVCRATLNILWRIHAGLRDSETVDRAGVMMEASVWSVFIKVSVRCARCTAPAIRSMLSMSSQAL